MRTYNRSLTSFHPTNSHENCNESVNHRMRWNREIILNSKFLHVQDGMNHLLARMDSCSTLLLQLQQQLHTQNVSPKMPDIGNFVGVEHFTTLSTPVHEAQQYIPQHTSNVTEGAVAELATPPEETGSTGTGFQLVMMNSSSPTPEPTGLPIDGQSSTFPGRLGRQ